MNIERKVRRTREAASNISTTDSSRSVTTAAAGALAQAGATERARGVDHPGHEACGGPSKKMTA
ncbi:MAG: hypothetical protein NZ852_06590 [SAR324 cluster bacterium]|nr:hypothetical protein [SAR324 cluster bacterium]